MDEELIDICKLREILQHEMAIGNGVIKLTNDEATVLYRLIDNYELLLSREENEA